MRKGLIIVFEKKDAYFDNYMLLSVLKRNKVTVCLINNGNDSSVLQLLDGLKRTSESEISILNLKKKKSLLLAVKAGVRWLINSGNFETIIYTPSSEVNQQYENDKVVSAFHQNLQKRDEKRVLLRTLYAIDEVK